MNNQLCTFAFLALIASHSVNAGTLKVPLAVDPTYLSSISYTSIVQQGVQRYGLTSSSSSSKNKYKRNPELLSDLFSTLGDTLGALGSTVGNTVGDVGGAVGDLLTGNVGGAVVEVVDTLGDVVEGVGNVLEVVVDGVVQVVDPGWKITVDMSTDDDYDNAWYTTMSLGTPPQSFKLNIDTGSADLFIYANTCSTCPLSNHSSFNPSKSKTYTNHSSVETFNITYADGSSISGYTGKDTLHVGATGTSLSVEGMYINLATAAIGHWASNGFDGVIGMGKDALAYVPNTTTALSALVKDGKLDEPVLGIALVGWKENKGLEDDGVGLGGGEYSFGEVNMDWVDGRVVYVEVTSTIYWGTTLSQIYMNGSKIMSRSDEPRVLFDTGTTLIYVSDSEATLIHSKIPGASYEEDTGSWLVPCNTSYPETPNLFFEVGGYNWGVPAEDLAFYQVGDQETCLSGVQGGSNNFVVLGDVWLKNHYLVLDYRNATESVTYVGLANRTDISEIY